MPDLPDDERSKSIVPRSPTTGAATQTTSVSGIDPAIIREFLEVQKRDIETKQQELELERQNTAHSHEYAKLALSAKLEDLKDERKDRRSERREKMGFSFAGTLLLSIFLIIAMYMGHAQIAFEAIKSLALVLLGGYGGYQYAARKFSKEKV